MTLSHELSSTQITILYSGMQKRTGIAVMRAMLLLSFQQTG